MKVVSCWLDQWPSDKILAIYAQKFPYALRRAGREGPIDFSIEEVLSESFTDDDGVFHKSAWGWLINAYA